MSGRGLLITGESGSGKSSLAMHFLRAGNALIADDIVLVERCKGRLVGGAAERFAGVVEVAGIGLCDVQEMFGLEAVKASIEIEHSIELRRGGGLTHRIIDILGVSLIQIGCFFKDAGSAARWVISNVDPVSRSLVERDLLTRHDALVAAL